MRDLSGEMNNVSLDGRIIEKSPTSHIQTAFGPRALSKAVLQDETGRVLLNLFGPQTEMVKVGDIIRVENGFTKLFQGILELSVGRRGKITVLTKQ